MALSGSPECTALARFTCHDRRLLAPARRPRNPESLAYAFSGKCPIPFSIWILLSLSHCFKGDAEATNLKLKNLNLYLHSVQQVALNQILQILNLHLHTTSNCTLLSLTLTRELVFAAFLSLRPTLFTAPSFSSSFGQTDSAFISKKGLWQQAAKMKRKQKETFSQRTCQQFGTTNFRLMLLNAGTSLNTRVRMHISLLCCI